MKRFLIALAFVSLLAGTMTSCKSHERCPAYGKIEKVNTNSVRA